jgi:hypothetical protein
LKRVYRRGAEMQRKTSKTMVRMGAGRVGMACLPRRVKEAESAEEFFLEFSASLRLRGGKVLRVRAGFGGMLF